MSEIGGAMSEMYNLRQISRQKGLKFAPGSDKTHKRFASLQEMSEIKLEMSETKLEMSEIKLEMSEI